MAIQMTEMGIEESEAELVRRSSRYLVIPKWKKCCGISRRCTGPLYPTL